MFLHWSFEPAEVRELVPSGLELDLFADKAWVSLAAFHVSSMRPTLLPPLPWLSKGEQINVRTYVHRDGVPGLWFFSLDITQPVAAWAARLTYALPYYRAKMRVAREGDRVSFHAERTDAGAPSARFIAAWKPGSSLPPPEAEALEFFLLERYVGYSHSDGELWRTPIHHRPWSPRQATIEQLASTMLEVAGLPRRDDPPLAHAQTTPLDVGIWPPERVARRR